jgi:hypothetical protein
MRRPAVVRFGVLAASASVSCWSAPKQPTTTPIENRATPTASERDLTAAYWCSISDGGYDYPPMPCMVRKVGAQFMLAKLAGSQRFRGVVKARSDGGLTFDGEFYCPWGDCTQPLHGAFVPATDGTGTLRGDFQNTGIVVTMTQAPLDSFGGATYGGDGYGGFGYGGFGGASYGGQRIGR